jgi:hypothetical protein
VTPEPTPVTTLQAGKMFRARFGLIGLKHDEGLLELTWNDSRTELDRDTEISLELFCDHVAGAYERMRSRLGKDSGRVISLPAAGDDQRFDR